jgi:hypothetical protein
VKKQNYLVGDEYLHVLVVLLHPLHLSVDFFTSLQIPSSYIWQEVLQNSALLFSWEHLHFFGNSDQTAPGRG